MAQVLLSAALSLEEESRTDSEVRDRILREDPMWLAIGQFNERNLLILDGLPKTIHLCWKLEYMGPDYDPLLTGGANAEDYTRKILTSGHLVTVCSFNEWNRDNLLRELPLLKAVDFRLQPIALKEDPGPVDRPAFRRRYGVREGEFLLGAAAVYHEAKGIDELARWLLSLPPEKSWKVVFSLITDREPEEIKAGWGARFGASPCLERLHVRKGDYCQWEWMASFYRSIDLMLVNSCSDSWGRVVTEAAGLGTPVLVRRSSCGTNHVMPSLVLIDDLSALSYDSLVASLEQGRARAPKLLAYSQRCFARDAIRQRWLRNLQASTPRPQQKEFARLLDEGALGDIEYLLDW